MGRKVKFYTKDDLASAFNLERASHLLDVGITPVDINDIIEIYNINKYFDEGMRLKSWSDDDFNSHRKKAKSLEKEVYIFFSNLKDENFIEIFKNTEYYYRSDFWIIFSQLKLFNKISKENFKTAAQHAHLEHILKHRELVFNYDSEIKDVLLDYINSTNIILEYYNKSNNEKIFLPQSLSLGDKVEIIKRYIDSENAHPNTLDLIIQIQPSKEFSIPYKVKLQAQQKNKEIEEIILKTGNVIHSEIIISFRKQYEYATYKKSKHTIELLYSKDWIENNTDYPTLLNNFIHVFEFVNKQSIFNGISHIHEMGVFERTLSPYDTNYYPTSYSFNFKFRMMLLQIMGYTDILNKNNLCINQIIEWFFCKYLKNEFGIENFNIIMPSQSSSYLEKCTFLITVIDSILKQYEIYIEEGYIDSDILTMQSNSKKFNDIKTLINDKYIVGKGQDYTLASGLFFSDQSNLAYTSKNNGRYNTFFDSFKYDTPLFDDFEEHQKPYLNWIIDNNFIFVNELGELDFTDLGAVVILKHLFEGGSAKKSFYGKKYSKSLNRLHTDGYLDHYTKLLTNEEAQYLNFFLNKAEFRNGLDLRNKYAHGIQQGVKNSEEHTQNYYILLHIIILLIIKINDDLCTQDNKNDMKVQLKQ